MECDSIMDISMNLNIDDVSALNEVSMEVSAATTPVPENWTRSIMEVKQEPTTDILEVLQKSFASIPNWKTISESKKKSLAGKFFEIINLFISITVFLLHSDKR